MSMTTEWCLSFSPEYPENTASKSGACLEGEETNEEEREREKGKREREREERENVHEWRSQECSHSFLSLFPFLSFFLVCSNINETF